MADCRCAAPPTLRAHVRERPRKGTEGDLEGPAHFDWTILSTMGGSFEPGTVFAERYVIEAQLGGGAAGVVLSATHAELKQRVAIKLLRDAAPDRRRADDPRGARRARRCTASTSCA